MWSRLAPRTELCLALSLPSGAREGTQTHQQRSRNSGGLQRKRRQYSWGCDHQ